jgi:UDP-N-acetyl-alpha-D-muramoyl-L-alanyl-L-glutamate epimerase
VSRVSGEAAGGTFEPGRYDTFAYAGFDADPRTLTITGRYRLSGDAGEVEFSETFVLAAGEEPLSPARTAALRNVARLLWLAAGPSYYKTAAPRTVVVPALSPAEREWLEALYREGLGEFAAVNGIDL